MRFIHLQNDNGHYLKGRELFTAPLVLDDTSGDLSLASTWLSALTAGSTAWLLHPRAEGCYENRNHCDIQKAECSDALMLSFSLQDRCILLFLKNPLNTLEV